MFTDTTDSILTYKSIIGIRKIDENLIRVKKYWIVDIVKKIEINILNLDKIW